MEKCRVTGWTQRACNDLKAQHPDEVVCYLRDCLVEGNLRPNDCMRIHAENVRNGILSLESFRDLVDQHHPSQFRRCPFAEEAYRTVVIWLRQLEAGK